MDYFEARELRYKNCSNNLLDIALKLKEKGYTVQSCKLHKYPVDFRVIDINNKCVNFGFNEVPYRWYIGQNQNNAAYESGLYNGNTYKVGFEIDDIIKNCVYPIAHSYDSIYTDI